MSKDGTINKYLIKNKKQKIKDVERNEEIKLSICNEIENSSFCDFSDGTNLENENNIRLEAKNSTNLFKEEVNLKKNKEESENNKNIAINKTNNTKGKKRAKIETKDKRRETLKLFLTVNSNKKVENKKNDDEIIKTDISHSFIDESVDKSAEEESLKILEQGKEKTHNIFVSKLPKKNLDEDSVNDLRERKERILNFSETKLTNIPNNTINIHLFMPKKLQKLSRIFRVLQTIQKFNFARKLTTIFIKSVKCIENLIKQNVSIEDIKRMYYISPDMFKFKKVKILHNEEEVDSFTIVCDGDPHEFDVALFEYVKKEHDIFLKEKNYFSVNGRLHPEFNIEKIPEIPQKPLFLEEKVENKCEIIQEEKSVVEKKAKISSKALSVLERIKERERQRREAFIDNSQKEGERKDLVKKIKTLFKTEGKRALSVERVVSLLKLFDGKNIIQELVKDESSLLYIKYIENVEFLVFKEK